MYTKAKKTISHVTPQSPMTNEEKKARIMQFLQQKRESFSLTILNGLCSNPEAVSKKVVVTGDERQRIEINNGGILVTKAVEMADALLEKLYPIKEEESK